LRIYITCRKSVSKFSRSFNLVLGNLVIKNSRYINILYLVFWKKVMKI